MAPKGTVNLNSNLSYTFTLSVHLWCGADQVSCILISSVGCHLVFVPSQRDICHHLIYPQPPFTLPNLSKDEAQVRPTMMSLGLYTYIKPEGAGFMPRLCDLSLFLSSRESEQRRVQLHINKHLIVMVHDHCAI